jgi:hypothetical protein
VVQVDIVAEVWVALETDVTHFGDSCFVSNLAMGALRRHAAALPPAIAEVVGSPRFEPARRANALVERNTPHLFLLYFELSDAHGPDPTPLLRSLRGPVLHEALVAVYHVWGLPRGAARRPAMRRTLYEAYQALVAVDPDWVGDRNALSAAVAAGSLALTDGPAEPLAARDVGRQDG